MISRRKETKLAQDPVNMKKIVTSPSGQFNSAWGKNWILIRRHSRDQPSYQDLDLTSMLTSLALHNLNRRCQTSLDSLSVKRKIGGQFQPRKWLVLVPVNTPPKITWMKTSTRPSRRPSKQGLELINLVLSISISTFRRCLPVQAPTQDTLTLTVWNEPIKKYSI